MSELDTQHRSRMPKIKIKKEYKNGGNAENEDESEFQTKFDTHEPVSLFKPKRDSKNSKTQGSKSKHSKNHQKSSSIFTDDVKQAWRSNYKRYIFSWSVLAIFLLTFQDMTQNDAKLTRSAKSSMMDRLNILLAPDGRNSRIQSGRSGAAAANDTDDYSLITCFTPKILDDKYLKDIHDLEHCDHGAHTLVPEPLVFVFVILFAGCLIKLAMINLAINLPFTVLLMAMGILLHFSSRFVDCWKPCFGASDYLKLSKINHIDSHWMLCIFLPVLLFESAFDIDQHILQRQLSSILILALPGLMIASGLSGVLFWYTMPTIRNLTENLKTEALDKMAMSPDVSMALVFGSLISATDPVAVVALLKEIGGSKSLGTLIEGEALLNDGCAIILFTAFQQLADISYIKTTPEEYYHANSTMANAEAMANLESRAGNGNATTTHVQIQTHYLAADYVWRFIILSVLFGMFCAKFTSKLLSSIFNDMILEVSIPLVMCYLSYYCVELWFGGSGVLACVVFGFTLDKNSISPPNMKFLHRFFHMMGHLANTLIFSMVGIIVVDVLVLIESETTCSVAGQDGLDLMTTLGKAMLLYVILTLIRGTSTFVMKPFMRQKSKQFDVTYKEVLVMTWGGLRGAVSLCLAISLLSGTASGPLSCAYKMAANEIMLITTVVVLCTLVINATTIKWMLNSLGMLEITRNMHQNMMSAVFDLREDTGRQITTFRYDPFLSDASWPMVNDKTAIDYPYSGGEPNLAEMMGVEVDQDGIPVESQIETELKDEEVHENVVERGLKSLKLFYSSQFAEGTVDENVYNVLENHVSKALNECRFIRRSDIEKYWRVKGFAPFIKKKVEGLMFDDRKKNKRCPWTTKFMRKLYTFAKSDGFDYFMQFIVFVNMPLIFWELRVDLEHVPCAYEASSYNITCPDTGTKFMESTLLCSMTPSEEEEVARMVQPGLNGQLGRAVNETVTPTLDECYGYNSKNAVIWQMITMANLFFIGFYTLEFLIKIIGLGAKQYFTDPWNDFDFLVFIIGLFDLLVICTVFFGVSGDQTGGSMVDNVMKMFKGLKLLKFTKAIKALKFLRALRALKFLKTILPMTVDTCERQISRDLSFGYQIGRCYIRGQDELHKLLPKFVEAGHHGVLNQYLDEAEANRLEVHRELGVLQRDMPGLAISIKTKTACRTILNTQKSKVEKYLSGGVLDEHEAKLLKKNIEKGMKDIAYGFPVQVCPPKDLDMILNIPWLNLENAELVNYMKKFAEQIDFDCGDILIQEGEEVDGIYLIINGMVRISGSGMFVDEESHANTENEKYVDPDEVDENRDIYSSKNRFDYVCSGGLVGEIGCLVKGPATVTAECETAVTAFLIKIEDIESAFDQFSSLKQQIWRSYSISQAMKVIGKELLEFGSSPEQQRQYLDPGFVKELSRHEQLMFDETIEAVIVVYGKVKVNCASKRHQNIFKTYEGKAVSVIKQIHDKNSFKLIEQIISPMYESDTTELPKLLVIPSNGNGTDGLNTDILERMTQIAKAGYGPMNAFSQFQGFSRPSLISAPNRPSLAGALGKRPTINQVRPTVLKNYKALLKRKTLEDYNFHHANQRPVTVITETDE